MTNDMKTETTPAVLNDTTLVLVAIAALLVQVLKEEDANV